MSTRSGLWLFLLVCFFFAPPIARGERSAHTSAGWVSAQVIRAGSDASNEPVSASRSENLNSSTTAREPLALGDAVLCAIKANPEILSLSLVPKRAQAETLAAHGPLDINATLETSYADDISPSSSSIIGSEFRERDGRFSAGLNKQFASGTALDLSWTNSRLRNSALFTTLNPQYAAALKLALSQPLLKGFWNGRPGVLIEVRQTESQASRLEYQARLADQIKNVVSAYWKQHLTLQDVAVNQRAVALAEELLSEAQSGVKLGLQAPVALSDANAQVSREREHLLSARNRANAAGNELRRITASDELLAGSGIVELKDTPSISVLDFSTTDSLAQAFDRRPDLSAQRLRLDASKQYYQYAKNQALPQVDIVGAASVDGLAGNPVNQSTVSQNISSFSGDYADALDALGSGDYREYEIGIKITHPLENSAATAARQKARLDQTAARYALSALERAITLEVRDAVDSLQSAKQRIEAADAALVYAQESNQVGQQRFKNGLASSREVLERQRDLAAAELADAQATVDYQLSLNELWRARGELLERYGVEVSG